MNAVMNRTSRTHPLRIDYVGSTRLRGRLGMTLAPGKVSPAAPRYTLDDLLNWTAPGPLPAAAFPSSSGWKRSMKLDVQALHAQGVTTLVSLMEDHEYDTYGMQGLGAQLARRGITHLTYPIRDVSVPTPERVEALRDLLWDTRERLDRGENVVAHCLGGLGRTGLFVACLLTDYGYSPTRAVNLTRRTRLGTIQTMEQEAFVYTHAGCHVPRRLLPIPRPTRTARQPLWPEDTHDFSDFPGFDDLHL